MSQIAGFVIIGLFPWTLAAVAALVGLAGANTRVDHEHPTADDYQPMRMLTSRPPHAA